MNINQLFRSYKQKLLWEGILKSLLFAVMTGGASVFITSLVYHLMIKETPLWLTAIIGGSVFIISFLLLFIVRYYPTKKRVASRMDEIGLQERVSTMLEYRNVDTQIAKLQRQDAIEQIGKTTAKQMKFRFMKREFILCAVSVLMAFFMMVLPYNALAFGVDADTTSAEQTQIIKDLIEQLRDDVKKSELEDELKDSLNEIIDQLEEDLKDTDSELEQAAKLEQAKKKMEALLEDAITKNKIGEALQKYELTKKLGEAISGGDAEKVSTALDDLETSLKEDTSLITTLSETVTKALSESGVDTSDELYAALSEFSVNLADINTESSTFSEELTAAFDTAETAILAALEKQAAIEAEKEKLEETMSDAKDEVLGNEKEDSEESEKTEDEDGEKPEGEEGEQKDGEKSDGEAPEGEVPEGEGGEGQGDGTGDGSTMTEGIYDPVSGNVAYGEVFAAYYAEYLAALEAGDVPEDLQEIIDQYFSSLN